MAFATLEDLSGMMELVVFPKTLEKCNSLIHEDLMVVVKGRLSFKEDEEPKLLCEEIKPLENVNSDKVYIKVDDKEKAMAIGKALKVLVEPYKGDSAVYIFAAKERQSFRMNREAWVDINTEVISILKEKFGDENVKVVSE